MNQPIVEQGDNTEYNCSMFYLVLMVLGTELNLNNAHTEFMAFLSSFYFSDMYYKQKSDIVPFITLIFITAFNYMVKND